MSLNIIAAIRTKDFDAANKAFTQAMQSKVNAQLTEMYKTVLAEADVEEAFGGRAVCSKCHHPKSEHDSEGCSHGGCRCMETETLKEDNAGRPATGKRAEISKDWRDAMKDAGLRSDRPGKLPKKVKEAFGDDYDPDKYKMEPRNFTRTNTDAEAAAAFAKKKEAAKKKDKTLKENFKPEVIADSSGKWAGNALVFATEKEALAYADNLMMRWTAVRDIRATATDEPVTYEWKDGRAVRLTEDSDYSFNKAHPEVADFNKRKNSSKTPGFDVQCNECGKKFKTKSMDPSCPKCKGSDIEPA